MGSILSYSDFLKTYKTRGYRLNHLKNYRYLFPILPTPALAGIIADLIGDGHLQAEPKWRIDFTSKEVSELKRFEKEINSLFKIKGKIRKCTSNKYPTYNIAINSSPISRILFLCGVPSGQKVLTSFNTPEWILRDKGCFRRFCQRLFTCEGAINHTGRKIPQIRLEMFKSEMLITNGENFLKIIGENMLKYFLINLTIKIQNRKNIRKDGIITRPIRMYIHSDSTLRFYKEIGFEGKKQKVLNSLLQI